MDFLSSSSSSQKSTQVVNLDTKALSEGDTEFSGLRIGADVTSESPSSFRVYKYSFSLQVKEISC